MGFKNVLEKQLTKFGSSNSPTFVAMSIAAAKGIFRPIFTMSDKKESLETKRYTALREGLTEIIAIPIYFISGVISQKVAETLANEKYFISKDIYKKYKLGEQTPEIKNAIEHAKNLAAVNLPKIKSNAAFIGVCASALFVIPMICSITIKPIMDKLEKRIGAQQTAKPTVPKVSKTRTERNNPIFSGYAMVNHYDMKVGGL